MFYGNEARGVQHAYPRTERSTLIGHCGDLSVHHVTYDVTWGAQKVDESVGEKEIQNKNRKT